MTAKRRRLVYGSFLFTIAGVGAGAYAQVGRDIISPVTVVTRENLNNLPTVLLDLPGRRIDQLIAQLPTDKTLTAGQVPNGWSMEQKGKQVRLSGPAASDVSVRLDGSAGAITDYAGKDASIQFGLGGRLGDSIKVNILSADKVATTPYLAQLLTYPPQASPGAPLLIGVTNDYRTGRWALSTGAGTTTPLVNPELLKDLSVIRSHFPSQFGVFAGGAINSVVKRPPPQPFVTVFPETGGFTNIKYWDRFGELLVDAPISITPAPAGACMRSLKSATTFAFAGQAACVAGCFPDFDAPYGLMLDGKIELAPWAASQTTVMLGIPDGTTPGPHTISIPGASSSVTVGVLTTQGTLDQNKLARGESTTMRLRILGTDRATQIEILNRSPQIITIDGGIRQTVTTSGGPDNAVTRSVKGTRRGNFTIVYSVNSSGCTGVGGD